MKTFNLIFTLLFLFVSFSNADVIGTKTQGPALIEGFNEITSAAGTTTLTKDSQTKQILTGTSTQTFVLPDATTIPLSRRFLIINKSTGTATIQTSGGGALTIISAGLQKEFHLRAAGSAAGTWDVLDGGGGSSAWGGITGTLSDQTDLQTALNAKAPTASPIFTGTIGTPLTASRALVTDGSGNLSASSTTSAALGYLDVSSSLTTLLAAKAPSASPTFTGTIGTPLTTSKLLATDASGNLTATAANSSQASYLDLTSSAQTQLNGKLSTSNYSAKGDLVAGVSSGVVAGVSVGSNGKVLVADSDATAGLRWDNATPNKNYVTNWNAEGGVTTGWSTYADAAGTQPVDCTGGSPNSTWAASASSAIHDSNNFLATLNTGATRQGEGVSYAFTVDSGDSPAMMSIRFYYKVAGGTFAAGNDADRTSAGDSDFTVWIYDVTNGTLIQPSTYRLYSNSTSVAEPFVSNFQTNSNSTSYRLCIHKGTSTSVSGTNITVRFDDFEISRSTIAYGTPITDWASYTPTITGLGTPASQSFYARKVGDSRQIKFVVVAGTTTAALVSFTLPNSESIDSNKIAASTVIGKYSANATTWNGSIFKGASNSLVYFGADGTAYTSGYNGNNFANGTVFGGYFEVPIAGWSSSTQVSDGYDGRQITASYTGTSGTITAGGTRFIVDAPTKVVDKTSAVTTGASWKFTAPSSGTYQVSYVAAHSSGTLTTGASLEAEVYKNGSVYAAIARHVQQAATAVNPLLSGSLLVELNAGDYIDVREAVGGVVNATISSSKIDVYKLQAPTTMSATEVVSAMYTTTAAQSFNSTETVANFATVVHDTHNAVSSASSNFKFTAPYSGIYESDARQTGGTVQTNADCYSTFFYNGLANGRDLYYVQSTNSIVMLRPHGYGWLNAGQTIQLKTRCGSAVSMQNSAVENLITIKRVK